MTSLSPEARRALQQKLRGFRVKKGESVLRFGEEPDDVFFVIEGQLEAQISTARGREVTLGLLGPGDVFGDMSVLDGQVQMVSVIARESCVLSRLSAQAFRDVLANEPEAVMFLLMHCIETIRDLMQQQFELVVFSVETRVRAELVRLAANRIKDNQARIPKFPTHRQLAAKLGTTREAVTRELNALEEAGLIKRERERIVTILDCDTLARMVSAVL